jgi:hypothetical protein
MTKEEITKVQEEIEAVICIRGNVHDHNDMMERLTQITALLGNCARCISESKRIELEIRGRWLREHQERINLMKPSVAKEFVNTACVDEQILSLRCDRNYSALTKAGENFRTILSTIKTEMQMNT